MDEFISKIQDAHSIAILAHIRPDGDAIGSCLGLYNYIKDNYSDKQVVVFLQKIPDKFTFLKGAENIVSTPDDTVFDLAISLDCSDRDRHGEFSDIFGNALDTICLDHHRSNLGFGNYYYCDPDASSTSEVVYRHIDADKLSPAGAEALYLGIVHDTGVFKYSCASEATMCVAGRLLSMGVDAQKIIDDTFYRVSFRQNRLCGRALLEAKLHMDGKVISTCVTSEMLQEYGCDKSETDGIVDKIRVTDGVEVAVFVYQLDEDTYKFSLRSVSYVDVSTIAVSFGGGGHVRAAGFEASGSYEENLAKVLEMISQQI